MGNERTSKEVHPVLVREIVRRDGSHTLALRVFCARRNESISLETCRSCSSCIAIEQELEAGEGVVRCQPIEATDVAPSEKKAPVEHAPGDTTPVGTIVQGGILCVRSDAELSALTALFGEGGAHELYVVDSEGRLIGLVRDVNLAHTLQSSPALGGLAGGLKAAIEALDVTSVGAVMSTAVGIDETMPVRAAILKMAGAHLRELPIVTREGELVGVLRDIDALRLIASEQRRKR